jgi:uncharacterized tellurite resistance protein B-like protein
MTEPFTKDVWQAIEQAFQDLQIIQDHFSIWDESVDDVAAAADDLGLLLLDIGYHIDPARMKSIVEAAEKDEPEAANFHKRLVNKE